MLFIPHTVSKSLEAVINTSPTNNPHLYSLALVYFCLVIDFCFLLLEMQLITHVCMYVYICSSVCMYMYIHVSMCISLFVSVCVYVCMYVYVCVCICICMSLSVYVCVYVCVGHTGTSAVCDTHEEFCHVIV